MKLKKLFSICLSAALTLTLASCGNGGTTSSTPPSTAASPGTAASSKPSGGADAKVTIVKVGVVGAQNDQWNKVNEILADDNIQCELIEFSDYSIPNKALADGDIDMNAFQHRAFFANDCEKQGLDLSVLGDTIIAPLGLYSNKVTSVEEIKNGDTIAVPSDATNEGRCFKILEKAGLLKVDPAAGDIPELKDITENPLNLEFQEVEASMTASLLPDVTAAFINGAHAVDNGLYPDKDAIYVEEVIPGGDKPYVNILAVRTEDLENETYQKILQAYQTDEVAEAIEEVFQGAYLPAWK